MLNVSPGSADTEAERTRQAEHALVITNAQALAASLHAQAVAVQNFRALVPIILEPLDATQPVAWPLPQYPGEVCPC
jgi:hypothetical protein